LDRVVIMTGCAATIGVAFFAIALVFSFVFGEGHMGDRVLMALGIGGLVSLASILLFLRDKLRFDRTKRRVCERLGNRADVSDVDFASQFPECDRELFLEVRSAIAEFFSVPATKIYASDNLRTDFAVESLEPAFHSFVVCRVLQNRTVARNSYRITMQKGMCIGAFASEVKRALSSIE
jgi:hypothetical protein